MGVLRLEKNDYYILCTVDQFYVVMQGIKAVMDLVEAHRLAHQTHFNVIFGNDKANLEQHVAKFNLRRVKPEDFNK